jgi:ATP-dependent protease HslVU (ClpYQ) peptidase subunit
MTTIAVTKRHVAWDSRISIGDEKMDCSPDKVVVHDGVIYAQAGDAIDVELLISYMKDQKSKPPKGEWELLVIERSTIRWLNNATPHPIPVRPPIALGSGAQFARGAMLAGATAAGAVEIASQCDSKTGGPIYYFTISEVTKRKRR